MAQVSASERIYICDGIASDIRNDGRARLDFRNIQIDCDESLLPHCSGVARVKIGFEECTDVMVGVRLDAVEVSQESKNSGQIVCAVDCAAAMNYECGSSEIQQMNVKLTRMMERLLLESNAIDLQKLIIIPEKVCWVIYIDAMIFSLGGNEVDCLSIAIRAALSNTKIPRTEIVSVHVNQEKHTDFELLPSHWMLDLSKMPIIVTLYKVGTTYIVDPTCSEQSLATSSVCFAVGAGGIIGGMQTYKGGGFAVARFDWFLDIASKVALPILEMIDVSV